mmetsp:Transcript_47757/g.112712  ORF Transcript_47757/g.112712 Transcript_47757/m.112712 type:complete len:229 (+) Transcript_47757:81-767(+)
MDCLFYFLNDSWLKFQENCTKLQGVKKKNSSPIVSQSLLHFPLVCMLSWDFFRKTHLEGGRVPGFKSWVWNCLISRVVAEGVFPSQSIVKNSFKSYNFSKIQKKKPSRQPSSEKKDYFSNYSTLSNNKKKIGFEGKINVISILKKTKKGNPRFLSMVDSDSIGEENDEEIENQVSEETEETTPNNFILAIADKVFRRNTKWRVILKDGILHVNGKDLMFNICKCEFFW